MSTQLLNRPSTKNPLESARNLSCAHENRFLIREASTSDLSDVKAWLPDALEGTPAARIGVAFDAQTGEVAGVGALRVFDDAVGRFQLFVAPEFRRQGCGTLLLDAIRTAARQAQVTRLLSFRTFQVGTTCEVSQVAEKFFADQGLTSAQEIVYYRAPLSAALQVLKPLYQRFSRESDGPARVRYVTADQVDPWELARFAAEHIGGQPEGIAHRLAGFGEPFSVPISTVAIVDSRIVGALLIVQNGRSLVIDKRAVDVAYRRSGVNLCLMYSSAAVAESLGMETIEFEGDVVEKDTAKLAKRLGAIEVGRRRSWGEAMAPARQTPRPTITTRTRPESIEPLSKHTTSFAEILQRLNISIAMTAPQAGKLVMLRPDGDRVNTHFRDLQEPMGLALDGDRLAIGCQHDIQEFRHSSRIVSHHAQSFAGNDRNFLPRCSHATGNIQIHELAWAPSAPHVTASPESELWFVNTLFSCLCTRDARYSFVPRWKPSFISAIRAGDRCHLNGLCLTTDTKHVGESLRDSQDSASRRDAATCSSPHFYVTALGSTDYANGWRNGKRNGGVLIDTASNEIILRGLSLPHSPRCYDGRVWVLESGTGSIGVVDMDAGRYEQVAVTPAFTRGLAFYDRYAFIGLSKLRKSAEFGLEAGISLAERPASERACGVWVVDIVTGQTVAWLQFDSGVEEIFSVEVIPQSQHPDLINHDASLYSDAYLFPEHT